MNSNKYYIHYFILLTFSLPFFSCESFLEVDLPESQLTGTSVFEDLATADAAMVNIYADLRDNGILSGSQYGLSVNLGLYGDELDFYGDISFPSFYFYHNALLPTNSLIGNYWNVTYKEIYAANAVIEGVESAQNLSIEDRDRLKGEALFTRALLHFYLVNLYGAIPYVTTTDYSQNSSVSRMAVEEIYAHVIHDLEDATGYLPEDYYSEGKARPNQYTAAALLSRVYLYTGDWVESEHQANILLDNPIYNLEQDIEAVFLRDSPETIWQLPPAIEGDATAEAYSFTILAPPPSFAALSQGLLNEFNENDLRTHWIGMVTDGVNTWYYPMKYRQSGFEGTSAEYSVMLRLAEIYLIRAEARAYNGNLNGAKEDLNQIRLRAGLNETSAMSQTEIVEAILEERRREFFTEHGQRFFDLKRQGKLDEELSSVKPGWNSTDRLFPLPENELSVNPNLQPQNPGY